MWPPTWMSGSTASVTGHHGDVTPGASEGFSVLLDSQQITDHSTTFSQIGGTSNGADGCAATPGDPVCADLLTPSGTASDIFLSRGVCPGISKCAGTFVQALLDTGGYTPASPVTLVMKCDKSLCGGGSIKQEHLFVNLSPGTAATEAPACTAKGTVAEDQDFCVDYVQSSRDNAGDTLLYLLFVRDARVRFP